MANGLGNDAAGTQAGRRAVAVVYGALCHGLFGLAVAGMAWAMAFGLSRSLGPFRPPWSWAANAVLLLQFPLAHSFLLTRRGRALLQRLAPRGLGRDLASTSYAILASAQTLMLFLLWSPTGTVWWQAQGWALGLTGCLYAVSWLLLARSILDAGPALQTGLLGWRAVLKGVRPAYPGLPTGGLFRWCRQPIYLSFALTLWTVPTWTPDQLLVACVLTGYCLLGPLLKEARFRRLFGAEFDAYRRAVPYWLPWPRQRPASLPKTFSPADQPTRPMTRPSQDRPPAIRGQSEAA